MRAYKEKQFLIFQFEDGKNVKYDLSNGDTYGKSGKLVKNIKSQLSGYTIPTLISTFEDEKYQNYLEFVDKCVNTSTAKNRYYSHGRVDKIRNIGSFLECINKYSDFEQLFSAGVKKIDRNYSHIKETPKGLVKLCRERELTLSNNLYDTYIIEPNMMNNILSMEFNSINSNHILNIFEVNSSKYRKKGILKTLINEYNYKPKSLFNYVDNLITYEAIDIQPHDLLGEIYDYARMMKSLCNKFDKYPRYFLTTHKIACRNYNRLKITYQETVFKNMINLKLETKIDDYIFIVPKTTDDMKEEAVSQQNCLASYIDKVIDEKCKIVFMRMKGNEKSSLITLEINSYGKIVQARGKYNRPTNEDEDMVINKYQKYINKIYK